MKRSPLQRTASLRRRRSAPRRSSRIRDLDYLAAVRLLPCAARDMGVTDCMGATEPDHFGPRGMAQKTDDRNVVPLCHRHHMERHALSGAFAAWSRNQLRGWMAEQIVETRRRLGVLRKAE